MCINQTRMTIGRVAYPCLFIVVGVLNCRVCALFHVLTQSVYKVSSQPPLTSTAFEVRKYGELAASALPRVACTFLTS